MILPDVNLLVHAYNAESSVHPAARAWWESTLSEPSPVGLAWSVLLGYVRIATHPAQFADSDQPFRGKVTTRFARS